MEGPNPYATPAANVDLVAEGNADIEALDVSETWKKRFRLIRRAGGPGLPSFKDIPRKERRPAVHFNVLAFLFGPIYYLFKGMWRKAITLFVACVAAIVLLATVMVMVGLGEYAKALNYGAAAVFGVRANIDYYKKRVLGENGWW